MFIKILRISSVMAFVISAATMLASAAGASNWHSNRGGTYGGVPYNGTFAAHSSQSSSITVSTASSTVTAACTQTDATGTVTTSTTTTSGTTYASGNNVATGAISAQPCTVGGVPGYTLSGTVAFSFSVADALSYISAAAKKVTGFLGSISEVLKAPGGRTCDTISGSLGLTYTNPSTLTGVPPAGTSTSTDARLVVSAGSLTVTNTLPGCGLPSGTGSYTGQTFGLTSSSPQPVFWWT